MKHIPIQLLLVLFACTSAAAQNYKVAHKFPVAGEGGWDYLVSDPTTGRLFISHANVVNVVDENTGALLGTIPDTKGVHGIALATDLNKGFISNGRDSSVTVFDLKTLATITKVAVTGLNPDAILYDPFSHKVFAFNGHTKNATVINAIDNQVIATIALDGKPEFSVTNMQGKIYVNIEDKSEISVINATTMQVETNWPISPGEEASGLAIDLKNNRLFTVCDNKLMVILDAESGKVVSTAPIGEGPDAAAFDPELNRAYSSNGEGNVTVVQEISPGEFKVLETIPTQRGARTMTVDTKTHHLYLSAAEYGAKPEPTKEHPHPRPAIKSGTFVILDVAPTH